MHTIAFLGRGLRAIGVVLAGGLALVLASPVQAACPAGQYTDVATLRCTPCKRGTAGNGTTIGSGCPACNPGTFAPTDGMAACTAASPGSFVPTQGAFAQTPCNPGL